MTCCLFSSTLLKVEGLAVMGNRRILFSVCFKEVLYGQLRLGLKSHQVSSQSLHAADRVIRLDLPYFRDLTSALEYLNLFLVASSVTLAATGTSGLTA